MAAAEAAPKAGLEAGQQCVEERLTDMEASHMTIGPAISTLTFFRGSAESATESLRVRLAAVVAANPWLAGTLVKKKGILELQCGCNNMEQMLNMMFNPTKRDGKTRKVPVVDSTMEYFELCKAVGGSAAEIPKGSDCINKPEPLLALSVVPDAKRPEDTFAVIFSVSHVIIDGFTYYKLLSMLSSDGGITSLSATRKHDIGPQSKVAMGDEESSFSYSGSTIGNVVSKMLFGRRPFVESYYVDAGRIQACKDTEAAKGNDDEGVVKFVSTNDVLCSTFGNATGARVLMMPLNFRDRLPDFGALDAGNYEGALIFGPEDFAEPGLIRRTLQSGPPAYKRQVGKPLPGMFEGLRCRLSMVTNWTFPFFQELKVEGCKQMLHIPHCDVNMVPFEIAVVYRPRAGQLAVTCFVRSLNREGIKAACPVGEIVPCAEESFEQGGPLQPRSAWA